jgi:2'-5' RNA ligase
MVMRTFIAIEIPQEIKQQMAELQLRLKSSRVDASWPRSEGIHLTLKFLGEVPEGKLPEIMNGLRSAAQGTGGFRLEVAGTGAFPNPKSARVVWVGLSGDVGKLGRLQEAVERAMTDIGFAREDRKFTPHLTLGRIKYIRSRDVWLKAMDEIKDVSLSAFDVDAVSLIKSELKPSGAVYTEMGRVELL